MNWKRLGWVAAVIVVAMASGCRRRTSRVSVSSDDDIFTTDEFPGAPVQEGNMADDGRAMSPASSDAQSVICVFNGDRGTAICTYITISEPPGLEDHLYAHYFDGERWTPPVLLGAMDAQDYVNFPGDIAFLNTANDPRPAAAERDGDAVLLWRAPDVPTGFPDDQNVALFATYFDVSHASDPAFRYGFQEFADRLDVLDGDSENVTAAGFVTDGLCGEHRFQQTPQEYRYGNDTTGLVVFWNQDEESDPNYAGPEEHGTWFVSFDLGAGGSEELPPSRTAAARLPLLPLGSLGGSTDNAEETQVEDAFVVYNNLLFFRVAQHRPIAMPPPPPPVPPPPPASATNLGVPYGGLMTARDDVTIQWVAFDLATGTPSAPQTLASVTADASDGLTTNMEFLYSTYLPGFKVGSASCLGSDEGIAQFVIAYVEMDDDPDVSDFGSTADAGDVRLAGIDEATGAFQSTVAVNAHDPALIDAILPGEVAFQVSRNGDYAWLAWMQNRASGLFVDRAVSAAEFVTTRPDADGMFSLPPVASATSAPILLNADIDGSDIRWLEFQDGLGYICGAQSDPDVINVAFEHALGFSDQVFLCRLTADLAIPPAPAAATSLLETFPLGFQGATGTNPFRQGFNMADSGEGGNVFAAYNQIVFTSTGVDQRLFALRTGTGGGMVEIDSAVEGREATFQEIRLVVTPRGSDIGTFDFNTMEDSEHRPHPAEFVHVVFHEDRTKSFPGSTQVLRTRVLDARDPSVTLGDALSPPAGANFLPPFELGLPFVDPGIANQPTLAGIAADGNTVGLWFREDGHVYYQEFEESSGWRTEDGVSDPALVDDDSADRAVSAQFFTPSCACDNLHRATIFWRKDLDAGTGVFRLQVRVRE